MKIESWEDAPEQPKPTYGELERTCWELTEQNAELRSLARDVWRAYCFATASYDMAEKSNLRERMAVLGLLEGDGE